MSATARPGETYPAEKSGPESAAARASLRRHGKTFAFAGRLLPGSQLDACAQLYAFLRRADDAVDTASDGGEARRALARCFDEWRERAAWDPAGAGVPGVRFADPACAQAALEAFFEGLAADLESCRLADERALRHYAYRVAGTVGLLMADLLGTTHPAARWHAIDLGIAMQLTNIARDVCEDAARGRQYLPVEWIGEPSMDGLARGDPVLLEPLRKAVARLLALAEPYYESGTAGLAWLPVRARGAIFVAAGLYREIGQTLAARDHAVWEGRAIVPRGRKRWLLGALAGRLAGSGVGWGRRPTHAAALHAGLEGLPAVHGLEARP
ncbi:MAG: phytoene/squalene synthase family protein [Opitutales bacterium]